MDTPGSPGQSWEMRLAPARRLRGLALCSPLLPSVIRLPQSSQGELKRNVLIMSLPFTTFQWLPTALRMKSELSPRARAASFSNLTWTLHLTHCSPTRVPWLSPDTPSSSAVVGISAKSPSPLSSGTACPDPAVGNIF